MTNEWTTSSKREHINHFIYSHAFINSHSIQFWASSQSKKVLIWLFHKTKQSQKNCSTFRMSNSIINEPFVWNFLFFSQKEIKCDCILNLIRIWISDCVSLKIPSSECNDNKTATTLLLLFEKKGNLVAWLTHIVKILRCIKMAHVCY